MILLFLFKLLLLTMFLFPSASEHRPAYPST